MPNIDFTKAEISLVDLISDLHCIADLFRMLKANPHSNKAPGQRGCFWEGCGIASKKVEDLRNEIAKCDSIPDIFIGQSACNQVIELAHKCTIAVAKFGGIRDRFPVFDAEFDAVQAELAPARTVRMDDLELQVKEELACAWQAHLLGRSTGAGGHEVIETETVYSKRFRSVADWLKVLANCGERMSGATFLRRRNGQAVPPIRVNPQSERQSLSLAIDDLPPSYSDEMNV